MNAGPLQTQIDTRQAQLAALRQAHQQTQHALEQSRRENTILRQKLDALARRFFGKKSEQLNAAQLELLLQGLTEGSVELAEEKDEPPAISAPRPPRANPRRLRTPENLEVVREVIEPELVLAEPDQYKRIGQEVSRQLDYQPGKFFWQETVRPKYVRRTERELPPVVAPAPEWVADHGRAAPGLLAHLLVSKYCDHLPFYRQEQMFWQRHGVFIARQQMVQWTAQSVRLLSGITDCLKQELRQSGYVQVDETPVRYQDPLLEGRCGQGYLWTGLVPGQCVVYEWHVSRAARCLESLLGADFAGKLQCDGYSAYPAFAKGNTAIQLFGCWAHARRGFFEAQEQAPQVAGWILKQIGWLYRWEGQLRQSRAGPGTREALRASHHRMVVARLHRALNQLQPRYLPQSLMGQAISYALNQWPTLERFLEHGEVELDNNLVENAIRPTAIGKKNWLFFGSAEAGQRSAVMYTLVANCRLHGVEPYAYLKDVLERLPRTTNRHVALYRSIFDLVRDFLKDEAFRQQDKTLRRYLKPDLVIIDDMGLKALPKQSGEYLLEVIMRRYENRSTIMTSNRPLEDWGKLLSDVPTAGAILDRFLHHAIAIAITGRSYRVKDSLPATENKKARKSNEPSTATSRAETE